MFFRVIKNYFCLSKNTKKLSNKLIKALNFSKQCIPVTKDKYLRFENPILASNVQEKIKRGVILIRENKLFTKKNRNFHKCNFHSFETGRGLDGLETLNHKE